MTKLNYDDAINRIGGTSLKGYIKEYNYSQLVAVFGQPTFSEPSDDGKVQKEWVFDYQGDVFTIYDWKTYNNEFTTKYLDTWNIGGKVNANKFVDAVEALLLNYLANK
jgi:hypothetical protein